MHPAADTQPLTKMMAERRRRQKGFTLLELLVVIAIIGLLASMLVLSLSRARQKARDVKRIADMEQMQQLLEFYADDHQAGSPFEYPPSGSLACSVSDPGNQEQCFWAENPGWIPGLVPEYATTLPMDPKGFPNYQPYQYLRSQRYGYIMSFKLESGKQQDECGIQGGNPAYSTRCARYNP